MTTKERSYQLLLDIISHKLGAGLTTAQFYGFLDKDSAAWLHESLPPEVLAELDTLIHQKSLTAFTALTAIRDFSTRHTLFLTDAVPIFRALNQPDVYAWLIETHLESENQLAVQAGKVDSCVLQSIVESPFLKKMMSCVTYHELVSVTEYSFDYISESQKRVNTAFLMEYPELVKVLTHHDWVAAPFTMPWGERIDRLMQAQETLGVPVVSDAVFSETLLQFADEKVVASHQDPHQRQVLLERLHNGTDVLVQQMLRRWIVAHRSPAETQVEVETRQTQQQLINFREHDLHPNAVLMPWTGYEIEADYPSDIPRYFLYCLRGIGMTMDYGGASSVEGVAAELEISPGPFRSVLAAETVLRTWIDSGWLDFYRAYSQTLHLNRQVNDQTMIIQLNDMQVAAAYLFHPQRVGTNNPQDYFANHLKIGDIRRLRLDYNKTSDTTSTIYAETKGFSVSTVPDLLEGLRTDSYLSAAAAAELVMREKSQTASPYQRQLSDTWQNTLHFFYEKLMQSKIIEPQEDGEYFSFSQHDFLDISRKIEQIFSHCRDRLDPQTLEKWVKPVRVREHDFKRTFPNCVAFSRFILGQATNEVESIITQAERDFVDILMKYKQMSFDEGTQLRNEFVYLFPHYFRPTSVSDEGVTSLADQHHQHGVMTELASFVATAVSPEIKRLLELDGR